MYVDQRRANASGPHIDGQKQIARAHWRSIVHTHVRHKECQATEEARTTNMSLERMDVKYENVPGKASSTSAFISLVLIRCRPEPGRSRPSASPASVSAVDDKITAGKKAARVRRQKDDRGCNLAWFTYPPHRRELEPIIIPIGSRHALLGQLGSDIPRRNGIDSHATLGPIPRPVIW